MNLTRLDRFSYRLAATVLVTGVAGLAGTAQADTVNSAAVLLEDSSNGAIVAQVDAAEALSDRPLFEAGAFAPDAIAQTNQPTPLNSPNQLPPPGNPVPGQPSQPGRTAPPPRPATPPPAGSTPGTINPPPPRPAPAPGSTPGTLPTPLDSPNQLPPPGSPVPQQPDEPGRSTPIPPPSTPGSTPGTLPTPLDSPNQLPPPGGVVPGQPIEPRPTMPPTTPTTPPPTTRPEPPPRPRGGIEPGRSTATGSSYIGAGGNLGIGEGGSAVGDSSFAVFSKIGLTQNFSLRPAVLFSDSATFLIPVTLDFIPLITPATRDVGEVVGLRVSPYAGAGAAISTGDNSSVDFLLTGGVDVPIASRLTATAQVNVTFIDNTAVGLLLGLGYNF